MSGLLAHHRELLTRSAISDEAIAARGYFSAEKRTELADLGFESYQRIVPALVLPCFNVHGRIVNYQARPDRPRIDRERGREVKYETIAGSSITIEIPPLARELLGQPHRTLWITEGIKKGDALASHGLAVVTLLGVWNNAPGSDDWDRVALEDRAVNVALDSDVVTNPSVFLALERIGSFVTSKGARVQFVYLPQTDGKVGVDDFLAAGHSVEDLRALAEPQLRPRPATEERHAPAAWPAAWLLGAVERYLRRYCRFPSGHAYEALALFVLHTWAAEAADVTPYMLIVSPEKRSGKTRTLEALDEIVRHPLRAANITAAGVFQAIEAWTPTLMVDELDTVFDKRAVSESAEALRAVLNAGNRRGSYVVRGSQDGEPRKFSTFCPKLLAGIDTGRYPDTVRDRAIVLPIERRRRDEAVADFLPAELADEFARFHERLAAWAEERADGLRGWRRDGRTPGLSDRAEEAWGPLFAIADLAAAGWPERARAAATALAGGAVDPAEAGHGHQLLVALKAIYGDERHALSSWIICELLNDEEELPFGGLRGGEGIDARGLAKLLRPYKIRPRNVRLGDETLKGYLREQFVEAWGRYVEDEQHVRGEAPPTEAPQAPQAPHPPSDAERDVADVALVADTPGGSAHARVSDAQLRIVHLGRIGEQRPDNARLWIDPGISL